LIYKKIFFTKSAHFLLLRFSYNSFYQLSLHISLKTFNHLQFIFNVTFIILMFQLTITTLNSNDTLNICDSYIFFSQPQSILHLNILINKSMRRDDSKKRLHKFIEKMMILLISSFMKFQQKVLNHCPDFSITTLLWYKILQKIPCICCLSSHLHVKNNSGWSGITLIDFIF
jgi:hypothetical protein